MVLLSTSASVSAGERSISSLVSSGQLTKAIEQSIDNSSERKHIGAPSSNLIETQSIPPAISKDIKLIEVKSVHISGNTIFPEKDLKLIFQDLIDKKVTPQDLQIRMQMAINKYIAHGYMMTQIWVSKDDLESGYLNLVIYEAHIEDVIFEGDTQAIHHILNRFKARLKKSKYLKQADLQRELLLLNQLPGIKMQTQLIPLSSRSGATKLLVKIAQKRFEPNLVLDNNTPNYLGRYQAYLGATANSLVSEGDSLNILGGGNQDNIRYLRGSYRYLLNDQGTNMDMLVSKSISKPGGYLNHFKYDSNNTNYSISLTHPLILAFEERWDIRSSFNASTSDTKTHSIELTKSDLRSLRIGTSYNYVGSFSSTNFFSLDVSQGLNFLNAKKYAAVGTLPGDLDYTKLNGSIGRIQPLPKNFSIYIAAEGQYAFSPLLLEEQYAVGGPRFGRGYDSSELTGDHGIGTLAELRYDLNMDMSYLRNIQFFTSYDFSKVWHKGNFFNQKNPSMASIGGGMRVNFTKKSFLELEIDKPLTKQVISLQNAGKNSKPPRFFFRYAYKM